MTTKFRNGRRFIYSSSLGSGNAHDGIRDRWTVERRLVQRDLGWEEFSRFCSVGQRRLGAFIGVSGLVEGDIPKKRRLECTGQRRVV
jgi:hypothetical protein